MYSTKGNSERIRKRRSRIPSVRLGVIAFVVMVSLHVRAQNKYPIWDGVYTVAQAERGRIVLETHCAACHGEALTGGKGPSLVGDIFMLHWETRSVDELFRKIRDTMPRRDTQPDPYPISEADKLDVVAYVLQQNGFPPGSTELIDGIDQLGGIQIVSKDGPAPPRTGAIVEVIGCLDKHDDQWTLSRSTEPRMTSLEKGAETASQTTIILGTRTVRLLNVFPDPTEHRGHTVQAKGLLIKKADVDQINVSSLEMLASGCGQ